MHHIAILALVVIGGLTFFRLVPSDPVLWHVEPKVNRNADFKTGTKRVLEGVRLTDLDAVIRATPRTSVLAGTVEEGMITYISRSRVFGFPDYTTVHQVGDDVHLLARSRFGGSDLGVNTARVDGWLEALAARQG